MSKITRRSYKRKKIIMGVALFGAIGLVSTGFAAWVLSSNANREQGANLKVGTVSDTSMRIENVVVRGKDTKRGSPTIDEMIETNDFSFNPKYNDNTGRVKYGAVGDDCGERLSLTISGVIKEAQNLGQLTIEPKTVPDAISTAATAGYIEVPACLLGSVTLVENTHYTISENEGLTTANFEYTISFGWGSLFNNENPAEYYDDFTEEQISATEINETLTAMHDLLDNVQIAVDIVAHVN